MGTWGPVETKIDRTKDRLTAEIYTKELMEIASLSQFYYRRLFSALVRSSVREYVKLRRLARASEVLSNRHLMPMEVANDCGFNSYQSFSNAFKSAFGLTPEEYQSDPIPLLRLTKPELSTDYVLIDEAIPIIADGVVIEVNRRRLDDAECFVGRSQVMPIDQVNFGEGDGVDGLRKMWDSFRAEKSDIPGLRQGGIEIGASMIDIQDGVDYNYFVGAEVDSDAQTPNGYSSWQLPAGDYVVCSFQAETFADLMGPAMSKALRYLFNIWLPGHGFGCEPFSAERYVTDSEVPEVEVWVIPTAMEIAA